MLIEWPCEEVEYGVSHESLLGRKSRIYRKEENGYGRNQGAGKSAGRKYNL